MVRCLNPCFIGTFPKSSEFECVQHNIPCLNPCFIGTFPKRGVKVFVDENSASLNPCFIGTFPKSCNKGANTWEDLVLILVLLEHSQRANTDTST